MSTKACGWELGVSVPNAAAWALRTYRVLPDRLCAALSTASASADGTNPPSSAFTSVAKHS
jgi:hypothetical protein